LISFEVPVRPVAFARSGIHGKRHYTPKRQATYRESVRLFAKLAMGSSKPLRGPVALNITAQYQYTTKMSNERKNSVLWKTTRADLDNCIKEVADALNTICFVDDAQVASIIAQKVWGPESLVRIQITELE